MIDNVINKINISIIHLKYVCLNNTTGTVFSCVNSPSPGNILIAITCIDVEEEIVTTNHKSNTVRQNCVNQSQAVFCQYLRSVSRIIVFLVHGRFISLRQISASLA